VAVGKPRGDHGAGVGHGAAVATASEEDRLAGNIRRHNLRNLLLFLGGGDFRYDFDNYSEI
jgi:hypothetical protein